MRIVERLLPKRELPRLMLLPALKIHHTISDDEWNRVPMGAIDCKVYDRDDTYVGEFFYRIKTGQVGGMYIAESYRCMGLEQQMLIYMMKDMQDAGAKQIWEAMPHESCVGERFYSALWSFAFTKSCVHPSVTGGGYVMDIPKDLRELVVLPGVGKYDCNATVYKQ